MLNDILEKLAKKLEEEGEGEPAAEVRGLIVKAPEVKAEELCPGDILKAVLLTLTDIADKLDSLGAVKEANLIDGALKKLAVDKEQLYDAKTNNEQTFKPNDTRRAPETKHHNPDYQETGAKDLGTRYCSDHIGVSLKRIEDGVYQCPLCGKKDKDSDHGSVANQTPVATNVPIPSRVFDPREDAIGKTHS